MKLRIACSLVFVLQVAFAASAQEKVTYLIDNSMSKLEITVYKEGLFKALAHDHLVAAKDISALVLFDVQKVENSAVNLTIKTASLNVVDPGESEKDRRDVQATMAGDKVLDTTKFPEIAFASTSVTVLRKTSDGWELTVLGKLRLHGAEKPISLPLDLQVQDGQLVAHGETTLLQTDYGIAPINIAGGGVKVKNQLKISFSIVATKTNP